jgi:uncharacterized heparinase superfamily protein
MPWAEIPRFLRTVRHIAPAQAWARAAARCKRFYYQSPLYGLREIDLPEGYGPKLIPPSIWRGDAARGERLLAGEWLLAGEKLKLGFPPKNWLPRECSALQVFVLHYHEWLADLAAAGEAKAARKVLDNWMEENAFYQPVSWHPYPLSLRIVAWLRGWEPRVKSEDRAVARSGRGEAAFEAVFWPCLIRQVGHLAHNLEWALGGNHLIKNLKALAMAGLCLPGLEPLAVSALAELHRQVRRQVLPDGAHDERSPLYQAQVLQDLLELKLLLRKLGAVPPWLDDACRRMGGALAVYSHPDGGLSLFNDSAVDDAIRVARLIELSGADEVPEALPDAGYVRLQRGPVVAILDAGKVGPDENPGHAHADTLSFELSVGRERVIVNTGTYAYQAADRNTWRGTPAHSTVSVDGADSAEVWAQFRVGRRPRDVGFSMAQAEDGASGVRGWHDGYRHLGARHERRLTLSADGLTLEGEDIVMLKQRRRVAAHFHLHPDIGARLLDDRSAELVTKGGRGMTFTASEGRLDLKPSRYAPHFGEVHETKQLWLLGQAQPRGKGYEVRLKWRLSIEP